MRHFVLLPIIASALFAASAEARVSMSAPEVATAGDRLTVRGRAPRAQRVLLEQRVRGRWVVRARARGGRYSLAWRAPRARGVLTLRVAAVRRGRRFSLSRARRVAVAAVEVLRPARVVDAPAPGVAGTLRYSGRAPVAVGEHVALGVGPETPHGLLVRVVSRRTLRGQTVVETVPGSLIDAIPAGKLAAGSLRPARARGASVPERFRAGLGCDGGVTGELDGSLAVTLDPLFELHWSRGRVGSVRAAATLSGQAELVARVAGRATCRLAQTQVAQWHGAPLRFALGPIPVVIVPRTELYVSASAAVGAAVEAGVEGAMSATAGLHYDDGEVEPTGSFRQSFAPIARATRADGSVGARLIPSVTFLIYGQAGPRFDLATGLQFDVSAVADPWWTLTAPVELSAGLRVPSFSRLEIPQRQVFSHSFPIAQAGPSAAPEASQRRAAALWDSPRTDVDLHVWDTAGNHAWFRDKAAIPGALLSTDDTDGFGPEFFDATGTTDRAFTYGLCYFDDHGLGSTSVTLRLTDPDGSTRESVHVLHASGDSVVLGSSPPGSAFAPPEGWCEPRS